MDGSVDSIPDGAAELEAPAPLFVTSAQARTADPELGIDAEPDEVAPEEATPDEDAGIDE